MRFFVIILMVFLGSCNNDELHTISNDKLVDLDVSSLMKYVPQELKEGKSKVVYKNILGEEKTLDIKEFNEIVDGEVEEKTFQAEYINYWITEANNSSYSISVSLSSNYSDVNTITKSLSVSLYTQVNNGLIADIGILEDGSEFFNDRGDKVLNGILYRDVISSLDFGVEDMKFSRIYYNYEKGVVGFHDRDNMLWNLDRYEQ